MASLVDPRQVDHLARQLDERFPASVKGDPAGEHFLKQLNSPYGTTKQIITTAIAFVVASLLADLKLRHLQRQIQQVKAAKSALPVKERSSTKETLAHQQQVLDRLENELIAKQDQLNNLRDQLDTQLTNYYQTQKALQIIQARQQVAQAEAIGELVKKLPDKPTETLTITDKKGKNMALNPAVQAFLKEKSGELVAAVQKEARETESKPNGYAMRQQSEALYEQAKAEPTVSKQTLPRPQFKSKDRPQPKELANMTNVFNSIRLLGHIQNHSSGLSLRDQLKATNAIDRTADLDKGTKDLETEFRTMNQQRDGITMTKGKIREVALKVDELERQVQKATDMSDLSPAWIAVRP